MWWILLWFYRAAARDVIKMTSHVNYVPMVLLIFMDICGGPDKSNLKFESLTPYSGFYKNFQSLAFLHRLV